MNITIDIRCPSWLRNALNLLQSRLATVERAAESHAAQLTAAQVQIVNPPVAPLVGYYFTVAADFSFDPATKGRWQMVDLTGNHIGTLPYLEPGDMYPIVNVGGGTLTVNDSGGGTLATVGPGQTTFAIGGAANAQATPVAVIGGPTVA